MNGKRRDFFKCIAVDIMTALKEFSQGKEEEEFFSSTKYCYAAISELTTEELCDAARQRGIDPKGKSKLELVSVIYSSENAA
jgi:UDP-glucose 4-epimerase